MNNMKGEIRLMNNNTVSSNNPALVNNIDHMWHQQSFFDIHRDTYDASSCKHSKKLKSEWIENSTRAKSSNHTKNANFIPVGVKSDVFDRVNCPDTNNKLTNSSFHVGRCINFPTNDKTIVSNKDGYTSPYSDDSNTSSNSMRSLELLHWIYHQVNITNDHALKKNDEHVDSHPCSAYSEFKEMEQKFHKNCFSDVTNDGAKPNNLFFNMMDTWQSKHPEDWDNSDILDWIYFTAGLKNIQLPSLRGENFQGMTGKEFCKMTSEDFKSKDSNFGEKLYDSFRLLYNNYTNKSSNDVLGDSNTKSTLHSLTFTEQQILQQETPTQQNPRGKVLQREFLEETPRSSQQHFTQQQSDLLHTSQQQTTQQHTSKTELQSQASNQQLPSDPQLTQQCFANERSHRPQQNVSKYLTPPFTGLLPNSYASPNQAVSHPVFTNTPFNFQKYRPQQQHQQPPLDIAPNVRQPIKQESQVLSNEQPVCLNKLKTTDKTSVPLTELTASSSCRPTAQLVFPSLLAPIGHNFSLAQHQRQFPFSFKNNLYQYVIQQALLQQQQQLQQLQLQIQQQTQQQQQQQHNLHKEKQNPHLFLSTTQCDPSRIVETKTIKKLLASNEVKESEKMKEVKEVEEVKVALIPSTVMESNLLDSSDEEDDPLDQTKTKNFQPIQPNNNLKEDAQAKHFKVKSLNKLKMCPVTTKKRKREDDCDEDKEKITANNCHNENDSSVVTSISPKVSKAKTNKIISDDDQTEQKSVKKKHTSKILLSNFMRDLLDNPQYNPSCVRWENKEQGIFRIISGKSKFVAELWGQIKNNSKMTFEKMGRSLRWCRANNGNFSRVPENENLPKKLIFRLTT